MDLYKQEDFEIKKMMNVYNKNLLEKQQKDKEEIKNGSDIDTLLFISKIIIQDSKRM